MSGNIIRDGSMIVCPICNNKVISIYGHKISVCRQGVVHDFLPKKMVKGSPVEGDIEQLYGLPDSTDYEEICKRIE